MTQDSDSSRWLPLESDPDTMNEMAHKLGLKEGWQISELFSLDEEMLSFVSTPVLSVILLFEHKEQDNASGTKEGEGLFFVKQIKELGDACGTIALIHVLSNNSSHDVLDENGVLSHFLKECKGKQPKEIGEKLVNYEPIKSLHSATAQHGSQESLKQETRFHYVCFLHQQGKLWEIDGCKESPQVCGSTTEETFFVDAAQYIKESFFSKSGGIEFNMMVLNASS
eukprot:TRINITY_DN6298_c0_g1_i1.p1 TRINITY_DN6298_c0_g1~~TRINITY_DN6298_c0_g1_i1.p1  ORF type:complete len:225 (+),score=63.50 TRINITY_DN6298_c0_g1_i1:146-820(+)